MTEKTTTPKAASRKKAAISQTAGTRRRKARATTEAAHVSDLAEGSKAEQAVKNQTRGPLAPPPKEKPKKVSVTNKPADTR